MSLRTDFPQLAEDVALFPHPRGTLVRLGRRRRTFLMGPTETRMLTLCDGSRDVEGLKRDAASLMPPRQVEKFLVLVESYGLLATDQPLHDSRGSVLQFRLFSLPLGNVFTGGRVCRVAARAIYWALIPALLLLWWTVEHSGRQALHEIMTAHYLTWSSAVALVVSTLVIGAVHESAHGVTIAARGGRVFEVGMLLNYFVPAFFVDVSGVELLPTKVQRIQVWMAGLSAQISVFAVCLAVQTAPSCPAWLSTVLLIANGINLMLFTMNSLFFVKMDGYFVTQELLEIRPLDHAGMMWMRQGVPATVDPLERMTGVIASIFISGYVPVFLANLMVTLLMSLFHVPRGVIDIAVTAGFALTLCALFLRPVVMRIRMRVRSRTESDPSSIGATPHVPAS